MGEAQRFNDGRRTKYKMLKNSNAISLAEQFLNEMERRPKSKYEDGDVVYIEKGYRRIESSYYNPTLGWKYRFSERRYSYHLQEEEVAPLLFKIGDSLKLPSGVSLGLATIGLSPKNQPLLIFKVRENQYTFYSYNEILRLNPPSDFELLKFAWEALGKNKNIQTYCKEMCQQINPLLAL